MATGGGLAVPMVLFCEATTKAKGSKMAQVVRTVVTTNGFVVVTDTNAVTVATGYTPTFQGQFLFGYAGTGTNAVWVAKGVTTNDWVQLAP